MATDASASSSPASALGENVQAEARVKKTRVVSARVSIPQRLKNIWTNRELLRNLISTEIKVKYKGSALGLLWSMVSPAMTLIIYYVVFGVILKNSIPHFVIYLFSGLLLWNFFNLGVQSATGIIVARSGIVKKVAFPREILVLSCIGTAGVFLFFQSLVLIIFMVVLGVAPDWQLLPLWFLTLFIVALLASALGIALSAINVYMRDMAHLIEVILAAWFWACPIVYSFWTQLHARFHHAWESWLYFANPMAPLVLTSQRVIYNAPYVHLTSAGNKGEQILPPWRATTYISWNVGLLVVSSLLLWIALVIFGRLEGNFAEEL
jgi:ABC-2 type transport system permease protein